MLSSTSHCHGSQFILQSRAGRGYLAPTSRDCAVSTCQINTWSELVHTSKSSGGHKDLYLPMLMLPSQSISHLKLKGTSGALIRTHVHTWFRHEGIYGGINSITHTCSTCGYTFTVKHTPSHVRTTHTDESFLSTQKTSVKEELGFFSQLRD